MAVRNRVPRCPHCVLDGQFRRMRILENGSQICESCGHIVIPNDHAFCARALSASRHIFHIRSVRRIASKLSPRSGLASSTSSLLGIPYVGSLASKLRFE